MEDLYDDLENYNDVNLVNELRTENAELKHKLGECLSVMATLQKDFDKMAIDYKRLETNYSSLLKSARAEIKRKTDMITNLNVEKDMLILKHLKPEDRVKKFNVNNLQNSDRGKKKNGRNSVKNLKRTELNSKDSARLPSEASSTTTDKSNRLIIVENRNINKHSDHHREVVFPDCSGDYHTDRFVDKRVSTLTSHQFAKFSSDEEFEDMYSALEPKAPSKESSLREEHERGRKRTRDETQHARAYYDEHPSYSETFKDRYNKNRNSRYYENYRSTNRDQYDAPYSHRSKCSPDRYRRGKRELVEDRPRERTRRLASPPRGRRQHASRERPRPDREIHDIHKYSHPDTQIVKPNIHGEYEEPLNKRPRVEHQPHPSGDRRQIDKQLLDSQLAIEMDDHVSCQSPDFMHSELMSCNEPIREIRSTAVATLEDPRASSGKYLRCTDGTKDVLCSLSANKVNLQPVNKALWELKKDEPQKSVHTIHESPEMRSEDLVNQLYMDLDNPNLAVESKDGTDVTDYLDEDLIGHAAVEAPQLANTQDKDESVTQIDTGKINEEENAQTVYKKATDKTKEVQKLQKSAKYKIPKVKRTDKLDIKHDTSVRSISTIDKAEITTPSESIDSSLQHKQPLVNKVDESNKIHDTSKSTEEIEKSMLPDLKASGLVIQREFEHTVYSIRHIVEGDLALSDETNDETQVEIKEDKPAVTQKKHRTRKKSHRDSSKEKTDAKNTRKTRSKKEKELKEKDVKEKEVKASNKFCELFGDSSSLITPEEFALATTQAHARAGEPARDGAGTDDTGGGDQASVSTHIEENKVTNTNPTVEPSKEERKKTKAPKDIKTRTHSKHKKLEHTMAPSDSVKDSKDHGVSKDESKEAAVSELSPLLTESTKKSSTKIECKLSLSTSENKENDSCKDIAKECNSDMPQFFNDTLVPSENKSTISHKINEEKATVKPKETICGARVEEIPNLMPQKDETGLVKTVVISTGVQPMDVNVCQLSTMEGFHTPLKALATSTPAKELYTSNTFDQTAATNLSTANEATTTESGTTATESDVPDIRINIYRRRRKVMKKSINS